MIDTCVCVHCGQLHPLVELRDFEGQLYCPDCLDELTAICDHCGQRFRRSEMHEEQDMSLCRSCLDEYSYCSSCGRLVLNDDLHYLFSEDDDGYCDTCYDAHTQKIQNY